MAALKSTKATEFIGDSIHQLPSTVRNSVDILEITIQFWVLAIIESERKPSD